MPRVPTGGQWPGGSTYSELQFFPKLAAFNHHVGLCTAMDLAGVGSDRSSDLAGHNDRTFDMGCVDPEIGDERIGEALHREFRRRIGSVWNTWSDGFPEPVDAARVNDMALIGLLQQW